VWVRWDNLSKTKKEGESGLRNIKLFNVGLLVKVKVGIRDKGL